MGNSRYLTIDLLRNRRKILGIEGKIPFPDSVLIAKGASIGAGLVAIVLLSSFGLFFDNNRIRSKKILLEKDSNKYDSTQSKIIKTNQSINQFKRENKNLAKAITDIRSSSAIFVEISKLIPTSVQLKTINILDNEIRLKGITSNKNSLFEIIAFKLNLQRSPFFKSDEVSLLKASEQSNNFSLTNSNIKVINFEMNAKFSSRLNHINNNLNIDYLNSLGSKGLAKRLQLVMQEELL